MGEEKYPWPSSAFRTRRAYLCMFVFFIDTGIGMSDGVEKAKTSESDGDDDDDNGDEADGTNLTGRYENK